MAGNFYTDNRVKYSNFHQKGPALIFDGARYYQLPHQEFGYGKTGHTSYQKRNRNTRSIGLSVLTLLSFLFFLHILQNSIEEKADTLAPQIIITPAKEDHSHILLKGEPENYQDKQSTENGFRNHKSSEKP